MRNLNFDITDFSRYSEFFRDDSIMILSEAGTYVGPGDIEEYARYADFSSPLFRSTPRVGEALDFKEFDSDICQFRVAYNARGTSNPATAMATRYDVATMLKISYDVEKKYIRRSVIYFTEEYLRFQFTEVLATKQTREFICNVLIDNCTQPLTLATRTHPECVRDLEALPTFTNRVHFDGNSEGCRDLHGVFARADPENHCAHIAFEPTLDPQGRYKCQNSSNIQPTDLFDDDDFQFYTDFLKDQNLPSDGFLIDEQYEQRVRASYPSPLGLPRTTSETEDWIEVASGTPCETRYQRNGALTPTLIFDDLGHLNGIEMVVNTSLYSGSVATIRFRPTSCGASTEEGLWIDAPDGSYVVDLSEDDLDPIVWTESSCWPSLLFDIPAGMGTHYWPTTFPSDCAATTVVGLLFNHGLLAGFALASISNDGRILSEPMNNLWEYPSSRDAQYIFGESACFDNLNSFDPSLPYGNVTASTMHFFFSSPFGMVC